MIRYSLQRGIVTIVKSGNEKHIKENANVFDFEISKEDMDTLTKFGTGVFLALLCCSSSLFVWLSGSLFLSAYRLCLEWGFPFCCITDEPFRLCRDAFKTSDRDLVTDWDSRDEL